MSQPTQRPARDGEYCSCGRQAAVVYLTDHHGEVGYCRGGSAAQITPCRFCGSDEVHEARCPAYTVCPGGER